jgi:hypothetical protein
MAELLFSIKISDLKIVLARAVASGGTPSFELDLFQFFAHCSEPSTKLLSLDLNHDFAVMTAYVSLGTGFKITNQDRILLATIGTDNVDRFILEHL